MRDRSRAHANAAPLYRVALLFGLAGGLLFIRVWWPIQAERKLFHLSKIETQVSQKKAELEQLKDRYAALTALPVLDQWAKTHGPWVPPNNQNVIPIS